MQSMINVVSSISIDDIGGVLFNSTQSFGIFASGMVSASIISGALHSGEKIAKCFNLQNPDRFKVAEGSTVSHIIKATAFLVGVSMSLSVMSLLPSIAIAAEKVLPFCLFAGVLGLLTQLKTNDKIWTIGLTYFFAGGALLGLASSPYVFLPLGICGAMIGSYNLKPTAHYKDHRTKLTGRNTELTTRTNR
jgi:hypothetical protein